MMTKRKPAADAKTEQRLREMIEEATVDCYDEEEQVTGFFTMIEENLKLPFDTEVLGVKVKVVAVELNDAHDLVAVCQRDKHTQRISLLDLPLPDPPPEGADWIAAWRLWGGH